MAKLVKGKFDLDNALPTQYQISFKRLPGVVYNAVRCTIPGASVGVIEVPTPFKNMPFAGTTMSHGPFQMEFLLDENHLNFYEILNWMKGESFPDDFEQYKQLEDSDDGLLSDFTVTINSSQNNPVVRYNFIGGFPINLSDIQLDSQVSEPDPILISCEFEYLNYTVVSLI